MSSWAAILRVALWRWRREPLRPVLTTFGHAVALALALLTLSVADAALVRARVFVGGAESHRRVFATRATPSVGAWALGSHEPQWLDARDVRRLAHAPGVQSASAVTSLPVAAIVSGGEAVLGRALSVDVLVEGVAPQLAAQEGFGPRTEADGALAVIVHPQLLALYNATVAPNLGLPTLSATALMGQSGTLHFGAGRLAQRQPALHPQSVPVVLVGASSVAAPLGLTLPTEDLERLWHAITGREAPPPIKGAWLTLSGDADLVALGEHLRRDGLVLDERSERGNRALALGERVAWVASGWLWLSVALCAFQLEVALSRDAMATWRLLRLWGASRRTLCFAGALGPMLRATIATGVGAALAEGALAWLCEFVRAIGEPLGINLIALGPSVHVHLAWLWPCGLSTAGLSALAVAWVAWRSARPSGNLRPTPQKLG